MSRVPLVAGVVAGWLAATPAGTGVPLVRVSGRSPFAGCEADRVSSQPGWNYAGSEVEPRVAADPANPRHLVGTFQQDRWSSGGARGIVSAASFDGGDSWTSVVLPGLTACSGGAQLRASDPWVSIAPNGDVFHAALSFDPEGVGATSAVVVNRSLDGGLTWGPPISVIIDSEGPFNDKESLLADPTDPASQLVYVVWDRLVQEGRHYRGPATFARSVDGGRSWEPARAIYDPGLDNQTLGHQVLALPDGRLVDLFTELVTTVGAEGAVRVSASLSVLQSTDKGVTWRGPGGKPSLAAQLLPRGVVNPHALQPPRSPFGPREGRPIRTGSGLADVAVDATTGALYAVWQDGRFDGFRSDAIAFALSADGGETWTAPIRVNQTPPDPNPDFQQAFTPSVRVAPDGTVGVTYYDFRRVIALFSGAPTNFWMVRCRPTTPTSCADPASWEREARVTPLSFDIERAPSAGGYFVGDYEGLETDGLDFLAFFSQTEEGDPASVFFRRVGVQGAAGARTFAVRQGPVEASPAPPGLAHGAHTAY